jgi:predicted nucleic acid-binding protein
MAEVRGIEGILTLLPDVPAIYPEWKRLVSDHKVSGLKVYDARLVAIMNVYAVRSILTFNTADFTRYRGLLVLHPSQIQ